MACNLIRDTKPAAVRIKELWSECIKIYARKDYYFESILVEYIFCGCAVCKIAPCCDPDIVIEILGQVYPKSSPRRGRCNGHHILKIYGQQISQVCAVTLASSPGEVLT